MSTFLSVANIVIIFSSTGIYVWWVIDVNHGAFLMTQNSNLSCCIGGNFHLFLTLASAALNFTLHMRDTYLSIWYLAHRGGMRALFPEACVGYQTEFPQCHLKRKLKLEIDKHWLQLQPYLPNQWIPYTSLTRW